MRLYHLLPAQHAIDDIEKARIRLSEIDDLNDPFELWCCAQETKRKRLLLRAWKQDMAQGLLIIFDIGDLSQTLTALIEQLIAR